MSENLSIVQNVRHRVIIAGCVSLVVFFLIHLFPETPNLPHRESMRRAAEIMEEAIDVLRQAHREAGLQIDLNLDPNRTCLVGPEYSGITTTLGHLHAKRTSTNPDMAGLIVHLLHLAGVTAGDTIAVGSSASFPAMLVASLSAAKAMDVIPLTIISIGASMYGGTDPEFNLLDMTRNLLDAGVFQIPPIAVTLGGGRDIGEGFDPALKARIIRQIRDSGLPTFRKPDLRENVLTRMGLYLGEKKNRRISAFINTGGSYANLGISSLALNLKPGLNFQAAIPPEPERGVLFEMLSQDIPCIHMLYIRGLVSEYGFPWDAQPLPEPGTFQPRTDQSGLSLKFWWVAGPYLLILGILVLLGRRFRRGI